MPKARTPFEVKLSEEQKQEFVQWLAVELDAAIEARGNLTDDVEYWWSLYEQDRTRLATNLPWPDAADLTSWIPSEKVDALHARTMQTIFTEPIWTVEGKGEASGRAPLIEELHQWWAEEERLQSIVDRAMLNAYIEPRGALEISEAVDRRRTRAIVRAALALDPETQAPMLDDQQQPVLSRDRFDRLVEVEDPQTPSAEVEVDKDERIRRGPEYQVVPYRDLYLLPGHARQRSELFAYAKRFWRRVPILKERAQRGLYDPEAVELIGEEGERTEDPLTVRDGSTVASQVGRTAEKELWEVLVLYDFNEKDGDGERWYLVTLHKDKRQILRVQHDDLGPARWVLFVPFPRSDSVDGYSAVGHKLITAAEEHTAWRNMAADRSSMAAQAPIKRVTGSLWDPEEQPWGPKAVIDVRDLNELEPVQVPDVPISVFNNMQRVENAAERIVGVNDTAAGQESAKPRTLGEIEIVTQSSFVRMNLVIKRMQESMEDLGQIRHQIWKRTLAEQDEGQDVPPAVLTGLEIRGEAVPETITADMLEGVFRFKPRGSVETADPNRQRFDFERFMQGLPVILQLWPAAAQLMNNPQAARSMLEHFLRINHVPGRQAILGSAMGDQAQPQAGGNVLDFQQLLGLASPQQGVAAVPEAPLSTVA